MSEWFDTFFDALAHDVWDALVPPEASDAEATWLAARLELRDDVAARSARRPVRPRHGWRSASLPVATT